MKFCDSKANANNYAEMEFLLAGNGHEGESIQAKKRNWREGMGEHTELKNRIKYQVSGRKETESSEVWEQEIVTVSSAGN